MKLLSTLFWKQLTFSIRVELTALFILLLATISLFMFIYFPAKLEEKSIKALSDKAHSIAKMTAFSVSTGLFFEDIEDAKEEFKGAQQNEDLIYIVVRDSSGEVFCAFNEEHEAMDSNLLRDSKRISEDILMYEVTTPIFHNGRGIGRLYLALSLETLRAEVKASRANIALLSAMVFVVGIFAVFGISTMVTRPLSQMVKTVTAIAQGDLTQRASISSQSEATHLAQTFNVMVDNLESVQRELESANRNLETRVEERTAELSEEIIEHKNTATQLLSAKDAAETANRAKSTFLANMSHELRTPLNAIIGYSEMLIEDTEDSGEEAFSEDLGKIHTAGNHLVKLISDILDISKIEAEKMQLDLDTFEIEQMVKDAVTTVEPLVEKNQNTMTLHWVSSVQCIPMR